MAKSFSLSILRALAMTIALTGLPALSQAQDPIQVKPGDSLQEAIDKAPDGAVIELAEGVYPERIFIAKSLTIRGSGKSPSVILPNSLHPSTSLKQMEEYARRVKGVKDALERTKIDIEFRRATSPPVVYIGRIGTVMLENLRISTPPAESDKIQGDALIEVLGADLKIDKCEIVGPWSNGIFVGNKSKFTITNSLIASFWGAGIAVFGSKTNENKKKATISNCEIRNCHYRGIIIAPDTDVTVEKCRISGSAGHGIRFDNTSPTITNNIIHQNAQSGIYANGKCAATITGNVFWKNGQNGMSCWYANENTIQNNTFYGNGNEGLAILGNGSPIVKSNIFANHKTAIVNSFINSKQIGANVFGEPELAGNFFWKNEQSITKPAEEEGKPRIEIPLGPDATVGLAPKFANAESGDFTLAKDSPARAKKVGAADPLGPMNRWPVQEEELLIVPEGNDRSSKAWKRPSSQADVGTLADLRASALSWKNNITRLKDPARKKQAIEEMRAAVDDLTLELETTGKP